MTSPVSAISCQWFATWLCSPVLCQSLSIFFLCIPCWSYCVSMYQVCIKDFLVLFSWFPIGSIFRLFWHWLWNVLVIFACIWPLNLDYDSWICPNKALRLYTYLLSLTTHYKRIFTTYIWIPLYNALGHWSKTEAFLNKSLSHNGIETWIVMSEKHWAPSIVLSICICGAK